MAGIRINNAKNFAGELYATQNWADDKFLTSILAGNGIEVTANNNIAVKLDAAGEAFLTAGADGIKLTGVQAAIDTAVAGTVAGLHVAKLDSATDGYAASYQLQDADGNVQGVTIDILRDQFLKSAQFGWFTKGDGAYAESSKGAAGAIPCIKVEVWVSDAKDSEAVASTIYIEVQDLFDVYTAGNGLQENAGEFSVKRDASSEDFLSVGADGVKVAGVQDAIDAAKQEAIDAAFASAAEQLKGRLLYKGTVTKVGNLPGMVPASGVAEAGKEYFERHTYTSVTDPDNVVQYWYSKATVADGADVSAYYVGGPAVGDSYGIFDPTGVTMGVDDKMLDAYSFAVYNNCYRWIKLCPGSEIEQIANGLAQLAAQVGSLTTVKEESAALSYAGNVATATVAGRVLAVYGEDGSQVYPDATYANGSTTLTATYAAGNHETAWTVVHTI